MLPHSARKENTDSVVDCRGVRICDKCYLLIGAIVIQSRSLQREASKFVRFARFVFLKTHSATLREIRAIRVQNPSADSA